MQSRKSQARESQNRKLQTLVRGELSLETPTRRRWRLPLRRLSVVTFLAWGLGTGPLAAQPLYQQQLIPGFSSLVADDLSTPDLVDLDGDGDFDVVLGGRDGRLHTFENTGGSIAPAFVGQVGTANPFDGIDVGTDSSPDLADLDGDGDLDAVVGVSDGSLRTFENTGGSIAPAFVEMMGTANPFDGIDVGTDSSPDLADLDGDGDLDVVVGSTNRLFLENTGSSSTPAFMALTGSANPFDGIAVNNSDSPALADFDGDGDFDTVFGEMYGRLLTFENTGSSIAPAFVRLTGSADPFRNIDVGESSSAELVDLDDDGDIDAVIGEFYGRLFAYENTGSSSAPAFVFQNGALNPFDGIDVGLFSTPALADLDGDGDLDAVVGDRNGRIIFLRSLRKDIFSNNFESGGTSAWSNTVP